MRRALLDQGLPVTAAIILRQEGWDAVHVREIAMHKAAEEDILEYAAKESRVLITLDRDFPQMLALTCAAWPSVVLIRQQGLRGPEIAVLLASIWREKQVHWSKGVS